MAISKKNQSIINILNNYEKKLIDLQENPPKDLQKVLVAVRLKLSSLKSDQIFQPYRYDIEKLIYKSDYIETLSFKRKKRKQIFTIVVFALSLICFIVLINFPIESNKLSSISMLASLLGCLISLLLLLKDIIWN